MTARHFEGFGDRHQVLFINNSLGLFLLGVIVFDRDPRLHVSLAEGRLEGGDDFPFEFLFQIGLLFVENIKAFLRFLQFRHFRINFNRLFLFGQVLARIVRDEHVFGLQLLDTARDEALDTLDLLARDFRLGHEFQHHRGAGALFFLGKDRLGWQVQLHFGILDDLDHLQGSDQFPHQGALLLDTQREIGAAEILLIEKFPPGVLPRDFQLGRQVQAQPERPFSRRIALGHIHAPPLGLFDHLGFDSPRLQFIADLSRLRGVEPGIEQLVRRTFPVIHRSDHPGAQNQQQPSHRQQFCRFALLGQNLQKTRFQILHVGESHDPTSSPQGITPLPLTRGA